MARNVFLTVALAVMLSVALAEEERFQTVGIKGTVQCYGSPTNGILTLMHTTRPLGSGEKSREVELNRIQVDDTGKFKVDGSAQQTLIMKPFARFYTRCYNANNLAKQCKSSKTFDVVPMTYVHSGKTIPGGRYYDYGVLDVCA